MGCELTLVVQSRIPTSPTYACSGLLPEFFSLCKREPSTSPAQAARPELLEGGLLAPHPMDFASVFSSFFFSSLFFSGFYLDSELKTLEAPPQTRHQEWVGSDDHPSWSPAPRMKQQPGTLSLTYWSFAPLLPYSKREFSFLSTDEVPLPALAQNLHSTLTLHCHWHPMLITSSSPPA